jgi:hypothetical protein
LPALERYCNQQGSMHMPETASRRCWRSRTPLFPKGISKASRRAATALPHNAVWELRTAVRSLGVCYMVCAGQPGAPKGILFVPSDGRVHRAGGKVPIRQPCTLDPRPISRRIRPPPVIRGQVHGNETRIGNWERAMSDPCKVYGRVDQRGSLLSAAQTCHHGRSCTSRGSRIANKYPA